MLSILGAMPLYYNVTSCTNLWNIVETSVSDHNLPRACTSKVNLIQISEEFGYYGAFLEKEEVRNIIPHIHAGLAGLLSATRVCKKIEML